MQEMLREVQFSAIKTSISNTLIIIFCNTITASVETKSHLELIESYIIIVENNILYCHGLDKPQKFSQR